jgi:hypothetical protein
LIFTPDAPHSAPVTLSTAIISGSFISFPSNGPIAIQGPGRLQIFTNSASITPTLLSGGPVTVIASISSPIVCPTTTRKESSSCVKKRHPSCPPHPCPPSTSSSVC